MKLSIYLPTLRRLWLPLSFGLASGLFIPPLLYAQTSFLNETFSTKTLPAGWQVLPANAGNKGWVFNNPRNIGSTWPTPPGDIALADGTAITTELRAPVLNLTGYPAVTLKFKTYLYFYTSGGSADVDVSTDNGNVWTRVWSATTHLNAVPLQEKTVDLSQPAGNQASVMLRFRTNNVTAAWMVDDVKVDAQKVPTAPTKLSATLGQNSVVNLSWQGEDTAKFDVERSTDGANWQKLTNQPMAAKTYTDSGVASNTTYQYRVRATNSAGNSDYSDPVTAITTDRSVITYDLTVSYYDTYANTVPAKQAAIEDNIKYFADAVYEMSNGSERVGQVTIYTDAANKDTADVIWQKDIGDTGDACWFNAYAGGRTRDKGPYKRIQHCDIGGNYPQYDTLANPKTGGYALGHEWGHYFFGLYDEYAQGPTSSTDPGTSLSTDTAVPNSLMNDTSSALQGDYSWLNFSTSANNKGNNAQFRVYGASGWDTITRPSEQDPAAATMSFKRPYYPELKAVAPIVGQPPSIELSNSGSQTTARSALNIVWKKGAEASGTKARPGTEDVPTVRLAIIDRSGSVPSTRLEEVKSAIQHWVDRANIGDYLGIISFDGAPTVVQPLTSIEGPATTDAIIQAIEGLTPGSLSPALGDTLQTALTQFKAANAPEELEWAVYLFSSGKNLTGTGPLSTLLSYQDEDVILHTFNLSDDETAAETLRQLAESTGGEYWNSEDFDSLMTGLDNADQATSPTVDVTIAMDDDTVSTAKDFPFYIDSSIGSFNLTADYGGEVTDATLTLMEPNGNSHPVAETDCETVDDGMGQEFQYTSCEIAIDRPAMGMWTLNVTTSQADLDFSYDVTGLPTDNDETLFASVDSINGEELEYPQPLLFTASVGKDQAITGVNVKAQVTTPDGTDQEVTFRDDGVSPDMEANDGHYTAKLDYTVAGDYYLMVSFDNNAGTGTFTNYGISYLPDPTGKIPDLKLTPVGSNFQRIADLQVTVTGVPASQYDATGKFIGLASTPEVTPPVTPTATETTTPPVTPATETTTPLVTLPYGTTTDELVVTSANNGQTVEVPKGKKLKVMFPGARSTMAHISTTINGGVVAGGETILKPIDNTADPGLGSAWHWEVFMFEAVSPGKTALHYLNSYQYVTTGLVTEDFWVTVVVTSPPVVAPSAAMSSPITTCPTSGTVSNFCTAEGKTLKDVKIEAKANVSKATLAGQIDNQGWISNSTIADGATITGGTLTGYIKNQGTIADIKFVGAQLEGGTLAGTITNTSRVGGTIKNVHLAANAKLSGGKLAGDIQGDCQSPAQLDNLTVAAGSKLTCVTLGSKVTLGKGVTVEKAPDTQEPPPVEKNDLPSLGDGVATNAKGETVATTAKFAGGIALNGSNTFAQTFTAKPLTDNLTIQGNITVATADVKKTANVVVYLTYQATTKNQPLSLMIDSRGGLLPWDENPANLVPFQKDVVLGADQLVDLYKGVLLTSGILKLSFGYQLSDGTLVQSPKSIDLTVGTATESTETDSETTTRILTDADNGKTIELQKGQTLKVTLTSNPTTGYSWQNVSDATKVIKQDGDAVYVEDPHAEGMVGVGGKETFTFDAAKAGEASLQLAYQRPWEKDVPPVQTFEVKVIVK